MKVLWRPRTAAAAAALRYIFPLCFEAQLKVISISIDLGWFFIIFKAQFGLFVSDMKQFNLFQLVQLLYSLGFLAGK